MGTQHQNLVRYTATIWGPRSTWPACLLLWLLLHNLLCTQHLHLPRGIILTLGRQMWGATVSTRTPTATWWRRWCSRTSASLTPRGLATPRTKSLVFQGCSTIAQESSRQRSNVSVL